MNKETTHYEQGLQNTTGNLSPEAYWQTLPQFAGSEYTAAALRNKVELTKLHAGMEGAAKYVRGGQVLTPAECATEWYLKLGTHTSLYGTRRDLTNAAKLVYFDGAPGRLPKDNELRVALVNGEQAPAMLDPELLAIQMLLDATKDPSPSERGVDQAAEDRITIQVAKKATDRMLRQQLIKAKAKGELEPHAQRQLSDTIKFNFESRFLLLAQEPDANWKGRWEVLEQRAQSDRQKRMAAGGNDKSPAEIAFENASTPEEFKKLSFLQEALKQAAELESYSRYLTNGELTEHYFNLLLRHTVLSKDGFVNVSSTTARQDQPHDGIRPGGQAARLSHDAVVEDYTPNQALYIQLKAGKEEAGYHPEIITLNPFIAETNKEIRQEALQGLRELKGALAELVTGRFYEGSVTTLEIHEGKIKAALQQPQGVMVN